VITLFYYSHFVCLPGRENMSTMSRKRKQGEAIKVAARGFDLIGND